MTKRQTLTEIKTLIEDAINSYDDTKRQQRLYQLRGWIDGVLREMQGKGGK